MPGDQESATPRCDVPECTACRNSGPGQSRYAGAILRESNVSGAFFSFQEYGLDRGYYEQSLPLRAGFARSCGDDAAGPATYLLINQHQDGSLFGRPYHVLKLPLLAV